MEDFGPVTVQVPLDLLNELIAAADECAEDQSSDIADRYQSRDDQPVQRRRYERDMEVPRRVAAAIARVQQCLKS